MALLGAVFSTVGELWRWRKDGLFNHCVAKLSKEPLHLRAHLFHEHHDFGLGVFLPKKLSIGGWRVHPALWEIEGSLDFSGDVVAHFKKLAFSIPSFYASFYSIKSCVVSRPFNSFIKVCHDLLVLFPQDHEPLSSSFSDGLHN